MAYEPCWKTDAEGKKYFDREALIRVLLQMQQEMALTGEAYKKHMDAHGVREHQ